MTKCRPGPPGSWSAATAVRLPSSASPWARAVTGWCCSGAASALSLPIPTSGSAREWLRPSAWRERVRELTCLYGIDQVREREDLSFAQTLQAIVELLPPAWFYPQITRARI